MSQLATFADTLPLLPELILVFTAVVGLLVDLFGPRNRRNSVALVSALGLGLAMFAEYQMFGPTQISFGGMIISDKFSILCEMIYLIVALLTIGISMPFFIRQKCHFSEYYILLLFSVIGMMVMTSSHNLLVIFIGLEIMSISSYVLAGMMRREVTSNEAAIKYLLMGAFSTGFLLYGMSLLYGATGSIQLPEMVAQLRQPAQNFNPLVVFGLGLLMIGLGFKVAVVPFHNWTPDVYQGAPTPVTAFMSSAVKAASFALLVRLFLTGMPVNTVVWDNLFWIIAALTMTVGNLMALQQENVKRMLAYSSIAHTGYLMVGVAAGSAGAIGSMVFYLGTYALMSLGAFGILATGTNGKPMQTYADLAGYGKRAPILALAMTVFMLSMIGLPLTGGFVGKLQIFAAAMDSGLVLLTLVAVVNSALSIYYYLRVVVFMYFKEPEASEAESVSESVPVPKLAFAVAGVVASALGVIYLGVFPQLVLALTQSPFGR